MVFTANQRNVGINSSLCWPCLTTWTRLAALPRWFHRMLAWVLAGTRDAFAVLEAISTSAEDAFQDLPQNWVPHVSMRVCLAIVQTRWEKWETSERCATCGSDRKVARNMSIKSNTCTGSFCFDKVSPLWCFLCNKIFTVVSEAPLRLSLLRIRPRGAVLTLGGVARSNRALLCSPEHWSTECLFCKHRYNRTQLSFIYSALGFTCFSPEW